MTHVHLKYIAMVIVSIHQESINHSDQIFLVFKMEWFLQKYESHRLGGSCHYTAAGHHTCCSYLQHCSMLHVQLSTMPMSGLSGVVSGIPHLPTLYRPVAAGHQCPGPIIESKPQFQLFPPN